MQLAKKVEFQPFKRSYSQLTFFNFLYFEVKSAHGRIGILGFRTNKQLQQQLQKTNSR